MVSAVPAEEALARLAPEDRRRVEEFRDQLRVRFGSRLVDLRLFGSKVRGDDHGESDIDVLVLIKDMTGDDWTAVSHLAHAVPSPFLSPVTHDFDAYHAPMSRASGFYEEMRRESVRL